MRYNAIYSCREQMSQYTGFFLVVQEILAKKYKRIAARLGFVHKRTAMTMLQEGELGQTRGYEETNH